ncbi:MAG: hypothetical protein M9894_38325 [Planctomycetes bacterium]|nr:hypothetical protein [Planctomycetota bacterium]
MKLRLLLAGLVLATAGCRAGSIQALDGEWPIPVVRATSMPWRPCGGGPGGALVRTGPGEYRLVTPTGERRLRCRDDLAGARAAGPWLYRVHQGAVVRHPLDGDLDAPGEVLARIEGAREVDAAAGPDQALVVGDGAVYLVTPGVPARALWEGDALTAALDPARGAAWIAGRAPLPVIDVVDLATGEVRLRVPLPLELESASLVVVPGPRAAVAYAHDRPIGSALLVAPERGLALPLRPRGAVHAGAFEPDAAPPLCTPPGEVDEDGRLSLGEDPGLTFGRVAPLPDGSFVVVEASAAGVQLGRLAPPTGPTAELRLETWTAPPGWARRIEAVAWSAEAVVLGSSLDRLVASTSTDLVHTRRPRGAREGLVRAANYALATGVALVEVPTAVAVNTLLSVPLVPFSPAVLLLGEPKVALGMLTAPIWLPTWIALGRTL